MAIKDQKAEIFGKLAAQKTLATGYPRIDLTESMPSLSNSTNGQDFLIDLLKVLVGNELLLECIVDILTVSLDEVEIEVKKAIKENLKGMVNCGNDPSIPDFFKHPNIIPGSQGITLDLKSLDFANLMKINPLSDLGKQVYHDRFAGLNSSDFNTFLFSTIQDDGTPHDWGSTTTPLDIVNIEFNSVGAPLNNQLTVYASSDYSDFPTNKKTLTDFNNDFVDSIDLFDDGNIIGKIMEYIFGSISVSVNKTSEQLAKEAEIDAIIDNIINAEDDDIIDDSYFTFTNEETNLQLEDAQFKSKGIVKLRTCGNVESSVPAATIGVLIDDYNNATTLVEQKEVLTKGLSNIGDIAGDNVSKKDKYNVKINIFERVLKAIMLNLVSDIISPKMLIIFAINHKIVNGQSATFSGPVDFIIQNKEFFRSIVKSIRDAILSLLLKKVLQYCSQLQALNAQALATEVAKNTSAQLLSLFGVSQEIIRLIKGL